MGRTQGEVLLVVIVEAGDVSQNETNISVFVIGVIVLPSRFEGGILFEN